MRRNGAKGASTSASAFRRRTGSSTIASTTITTIRRSCGGRAADGGEPEPAASGGRARQRRTAEFPGDLVLLRLGEGLLPLRHRVQGGLAERSGHAAAGALSASSPQAPNVTSLSKG